MSAGSRNNKNSPGHSPVTYRKMVGIFCFLLKIHPRRQRVRCLLLLFLGGDNRRAVALLDTVAAESGMTATANDRFGSVLRKIYAVGFVLLTVQHAVLADVNAERDADGQQAEENPAGKRFFLLVFIDLSGLRRFFYRHFPQSLQPLQISLLPQVSQFARKCGTYKSSCGIG